VYGIRPGGLLVFVPAYHLRGAVHLTDRCGAVVAPLVGDDDDDSTDAFARAARRSLQLQEGVSQSRRAFLELQALVTNNGPHNRKGDWQCFSRNW